ncbi:MAG: metallophosphoesterase [Phocaeicola sp.]
MIQKYRALGLSILLFLLSSCATATFSHYPGVGRIKSYEMISEQLPHAFEGFRIAFASDFHYESRFTAKRLSQAIRALQDTDSDVLLLGGDYIGSDAALVNELFRELSRVDTPYGSYGVLGNHDYAKGYDAVVKAMEQHSVGLLEHSSVVLRKGDDTLVICGVRNPFDLKRNGLSPSQAYPDSAFVVLLTHTPDYVEDADVSKADLVLAGHTHGGQVSLFNRYTPAKGYSKYGHRFLTGKKSSRSGVPVIISNGLGTSRRKIRLFTPSEVVVIKLTRGH